jgi:type IV pilus assembly protein PilM
MANQASVWGIDIGQAAFKALRCRVEDGKVVTDAFDYIEYPKILSQPEAEPEKMIQDAIAQFLSRNDVKGCQVALAVPGQSGLAKFFKPPPVDAKKIPEIVKYEARQQIPFALEDVIWDFQQMGGAEEVDGYALETEVGLFAMKRDQVFRAMKPFQQVGVELDIIQLAPLSIYNFVSYDILGDQLAAQDYDPETPPPSLVVLSMGTDTTDLVITNGFRVWQRSVPLGGNHFTKQLTKELKLTFAKAEHLKRNARQAEDPKMVFQAMRPVFNDLVTEVQRSIGYFQGIDRKAKIDGVVVLGNAVKLPGLQQYLAKNLGYEVNNFEAFSHLGGTKVTASPAFRDNQLSFGVCYGLCLQGLNEAKLRTNLVPKEIMTDRLIRSKKPWAVASVSALLLACTFNVFFYFGLLRQVDPEREVDGVPWKAAISASSAADTLSKDFQSKDTQLVSELENITAIGEELVGNTDRQIMWLEMLRSLNLALPVTPGLRPGEIPDVTEMPLAQREEIYIDKLETQYFDSLATWFSETVKGKYIEQLRVVGELPTSEDGTDPASSITAPEGEGWVIELTCYHYFNEDNRQEGLTHVLNKFVRKLRHNVVGFPVEVMKIRPGNLVWHPILPGGQPVVLRVTAMIPQMQAAEGAGEQLIGYQLQLMGPDGAPLQPKGPDGKPLLPPDAWPIKVPVGVKDVVDVAFSMKDMGIDYPVVTYDPPINRNHAVPNPNYEPRSGYPGGSDGGYPGMEGGYPGMSTPGGSMGGMGAPGMSGPPGSGMGMGGTGAGSRSGADSDEQEEEELEKPRIVVPRYDFVLQFVWQETPLSERLQAQVDQWQTEQQGAAADSAGLALNTPGGA